MKCDWTMTAGVHKLWNHIHLSFLASFSQMSASFMWVKRGIDGTFGFEELKQLMKLVICLENSEKVTVWSASSINNIRWAYSSYVCIAYEESRWRLLSEYVLAVLPTIFEKFICNQNGVSAHYNSKKPFTHFIIRILDWRWWSYCLSSSLRRPQAFWLLDGQNSER